MPDVAIEGINRIRDAVFIFMAIALAFSFSGVIVAKSLARTKSSRMLIWQIFTALGLFVGVYFSRKFMGQWA